MVIQSIHEGGQNGFCFTNGENNEFEALCVLLDASLEKLAGHVIDRSKYR